jgi:hypothetical protein
LVATLAVLRDFQGKGGQRTTGPQEWKGVLRLNLRRLEAMDLGKILILLAAMFLMLWLAYRIGKVILRLAVGLVFLGLIAFALWHFVLR